MLRVNSKSHPLFVYPPPPPFLYLGPSVTTLINEIAPLQWFGQKLHATDNLLILPRKTDCISYYTHTYYNKGHSSNNLNEKNFSPYGLVKGALQCKFPC